MTSLPQPPAWSHRLADQLQVLSEVAESLTYRLLDLEERFAGQEQRLLELQAEAVDPLVAEEMELRLLETEERLSHIEGLLSEGESASTDRPRQPLRLANARPLAASPPSARQAAVPLPTDAGSPQENPFVEEGEQPFMDELTA